MLTTRDLPKVRIAADPTADELHGALGTSDQDPGRAKSPDKTASGWEITGTADKRSDAISSRLREWRAPFPYSQHTHHRFN
ncbi:hypothetical protein [Cognatiyoonia sp. IB215182]|uniref:hypothetical protein n=1 Tax=Cognatiyoonia sp. IB215182 TaxID=3097353 RepID=UPI002A11E38A|nr:hypothetical protein [Cognatiyoonia sp. IB215182]MDX8355294.1 hypothetical protein [Cognatiyoonia sp. IB215182]